MSTTSTFIHPLRRSFQIAALAVLMGLTAARVSAQIAINGIVNGANIQIGTLTPTLDNVNKFERGIFQLNAANRFLMNDAMGCQFRFFQIITSDPAPPPNAGGVSPTVPYVDPVSGGYMYQAGAGGADTSPFYENDDGGGPYAFPRYSDSYGPDLAFPVATPVHSAATGTLNTEDAPGLSPGETVTFETYVVFSDAAMRAGRYFDVLGGYTWQVSRPAAGGAITFAGGANAGAINNAKLTLLNTALTDGGFAGWRATTGLEVNTCPEPGAYALMAAGGGVFLLTIGKKRRKLRASLVAR